jgi:hypothetical protein
MYPPAVQVVVETNYSSADPSPLGRSDRYLHHTIRADAVTLKLTTIIKRLADPAEIVLPNELTRDVEHPELPSLSVNDLIIGVHNLLVNSHVELYVHDGSSTIQTASVGPGRYASE